MKKQSFMLIILFSVLLTACGGPSNIRINPEAKSAINTIAIIRAIEPPYRMINLGSAAGAFGAVGGAVIGADAEGNKKTLDQVLSDSKFSLSSQLTADMEKQLRAAGYRTIVIDVPHGKPGKLREEYNGINAQGADAVLDLAITNAGWVTEHFMFSPHWRPEARVFVALHSLKDKKNIYSDTLMYGYHNPVMSATDIDAPEKYSYKDKQALLKTGEKAIIDGLMDASKAVAIHVAGQLQR